MRTSFLGLAFAIGLLGGTACREDEARATVRAAAQPEPAIRQQRPLPSIVVSAPGFRRALTAEEIGSPPAEFRTPTSGTLTVEFSMGGASSGAVAVDLAPDRLWSFEILVDSIDPSRRCFGCAGARGFALDPAYRRTATDSVWVVWGRNSIRHPVVF